MFLKDRRAGRLAYFFILIVAALSVFFIFQGYAGLCPNLIMAAIMLLAAQSLRNRLGVRRYLRPAAFLLVMTWSYSNWWC